MPPAQVHRLVVTAKPHRVHDPSETGKVKEPFFIAVHIVEEEIRRVLKSFSILRNI